MKLSAVKDIVDGKDIVLVDDSIVRGTTIKRIVKMLNDSGANRIHVRIASPEFMFPSFMVLTYLQQLNSSQQVSLLRKLKIILVQILCLFALMALIESIDLIMMRHIMACVESFTGDYPAGLLRL